MMGFRNDGLHQPQVASHVGQGPVGAVQKLFIAVQIGHPGSQVLHIAAIAGKKGIGFDVANRHAR